jgi:hypothetical protein
LTIEYVFLNKCTNNYFILDDEEEEEEGEGDGGEGQ